MKLRRRAILALSFANLCYLEPWTQVLTYTRTDTFWMMSPPTPAKILGLMLSVLLCAAVFFLVATLIARYEGILGNVVRLTFLFSLAIPLTTPHRLLAEAFHRFGPFFLRTVVPIILAYSPVIVVVFMVLHNRKRWETRFVRWISAIILICAPMVPVVFAQAVYRVAHYDPTRFANHPCAPMLLSKPQVRVIYLIFDEWDYRLTFEDRLPDLVLPNIDRLRRESLFATRAHSPARDTIYSVPSLLTGRLVAAEPDRNVSEMMLRFEGETKPVALSQYLTLFKAARAAGVNTVVLGWYFPYCRLFSQDLVGCEWQSMAQKYNTTGTTLAENLEYEPRSLLEFSLFDPDQEVYSFFRQSLVTRRRAQWYLTQSAGALEKAVDPEIGLLYVHIPNPHSPYFYDRQTGRFDVDTFGSSGYWDGLALVDRTLGELREKLESAGLWDSTTLVITTDHSFRGARSLDRKVDPRIPFIVKFAGSHDGQQLDFPFNTVMTKEMILQILQGRVSTPHDAMQWIAAAAESQPSSLRTKTFIYP